MTRPILIETHRLLIGEIVIDDAAELFELDSDPQVQKYLWDEVPETIDDSIRIIRSIRQQYKDNGCGRLAMIEKASGAFMGWTGIKLENYETNGHVDYYDLGYRMIPRFWGKGFATESAVASVAFGFQKMGLKTIYGAADERNIASCKVLTNAGLKFVEQFVEEGYLCNWYRLDQTDWDPQK